ncbi:MAG: hypothetical protein ACLUVG_18770 [Phocaeicola vulgatus]
MGLIDRFGEMMRAAILAMKATYCRILYGIVPAHH